MLRDQTDIMLSLQPHPNKLFKHYIFSFLVYKCGLLPILYFVSTFTIQIFTAIIYNVCPNFKTKYITIWVLINAYYYYIFNLFFMLRVSERVLLTLLFYCHDTVFLWEDILQWTGHKTRYMHIYIYIYIHCIYIHDILPRRLVFFPSANFTLRPKRSPPAVRQRAPYKQINVWGFYISAAEILLRIYQNPIHLNGARWRTTFWA